MDTFNNGSVWYSKLESEVLLTELYSKLSNFPENEKGKVVISWLANSYADLTNNSGSEFDSGPFVVHIKLVNSLINNSCPEVAHDLSDVFFHDFLNAFVKPSLLDVPQNDSAIADATNYFQLVCENITQPLLIRKVVQFTMRYLLSVLVVRLKSNDSEILRATLGLFRALLEFYCEDIWHELLLQYLMPMKHLLKDERQKAIPEINFQESTSKFLDLIPSSIYGSLNLDSLSDHFVIYIQQELQRIHKTDITISAGIPLSKSEVTGIPMIEVIQDDSTTTSEIVNKNNYSRNALFPMWVFKYDGTDVIFAARKYKLSEAEEYFEDDLFQFFNRDDETVIPSNNNEDHQHDSSYTLSRLPECPEETIRFYAEPVTLMHVRPSLTNTTQTSWKPVNEDQGYFGPFLESLFQILERWTRLEPEVILSISDIFSVLASSRSAPLITSILLDFSVVLQPCFPNFHGILHSIMLKLDGSLKKYPDSFIQQEWKRGSNNDTMLQDRTTTEDLFTNSSESFAETLRLKILKSSPFSFVNKSTASKFSSLFRPPPREEKRILSPGPLRFENEEEEIIARKSALRCIIFTHWMLEFAAIAQQSCWFRIRQNQRQGEDDDEQ